MLNGGQMRAGVRSARAQCGSRRRPANGVRVVRVQNRLRCDAWPARTIPRP